MKFSLQNITSCSNINVLYNSSQVSNPSLFSNNTTTPNTTDHYVSNIVSATDYYPFGQELYGRRFRAPSYRFAFNGQEKDDEISGSGNMNTAEHWEYDTRLGKRWNVDPVLKPWQSPYACYSGNPIWRVDPDGADDFFNSKGELVRQTKTGTKIYVETDNGNQLFSKVPLNSAHNRQVLGKVATHYGAEVGVNDDIAIGFGKEPGKASPAYTLVKSKDPKENHIYVNAKLGISPLLDDYNNLKNVIVHEKVHKAKALESAYDFDHLNGPYLGMIKDATFNKTTLEFKKGTVGQITKMLQAAAADELDISGGLAKTDKFIKEFNNLSAKTGYTIDYSLVEPLQGEKGVVTIKLFEATPKKKGK